MVAIGVYARLLKHAGELVTHTTTLTAVLYIGYRLKSMSYMAFFAGCSSRGSFSLFGSGPCHDADGCRDPHVHHHLLWLCRLSQRKHLPSANSK